MRIQVEHLSWGVPGKTIVNGVDLVVGDGETVGLIGPNGSGKSSLLRCIAGLRTPTGGVVRYDGADIASWSAREKARQLAFVEQTADTDSDLRVSEVVMLGRTAHRSRWRGPDAADHEVVAAALDRLGLTALADRPWKQLSGGERQRTHLARALAQRTSALLLDEPTNHLDVRHQLELMELASSTPQTVVVALHDLALAARYCDRLVLMHGGTVVADGPAADVLTAPLLRAVFDVEAEIGRDSLGHLAVGYREPVR
ncbi:iron complex transport system ATP-binding protein [Lentzea xinjiangensis]|uniref:Iron complex transport system ATP-binding protein n=1 Tax=Lentzea xinjiangensis TaxID=402600 RepID=A0A1H9VHA0_9PSEU|nr:ABC transporter ATP-binding protein [Lentzea xinjiangensis]SES21180.1 iron complex transport system ATP-binding protein [Lentzea xinjiangensis]